MKLEMYVLAKWANKMHVKLLNVNCNALKMNWDKIDVHNSFAKRTLNLRKED